MKLQVFLEEIEINGELHLREKLKCRHKDSHGAFWLVDEVPTLALFINNESACLYFMPSDGGDDAWSKSTSYSGSGEDTLEFLIENYQSDEISLEAVISTEVAIEAFVYYFNRKELSTKVTWS